MAGFSAGNSRRSQPRLPFQNHRGQDLQAFEPIAGLLGDRHGDGRHPQRCSAGAQGKRPETRTVVREPDNSPLLGSGIPQERGADGAPTESHPRFRPHPMQGWTPDFIPKLAEDAVKDGLIDEVLPVKGADPAPGARPRAKGRDLHRYHRRRHLCRRAANLRARREGREGSMHATRHRGTLSEHAVVRGYPCRDDR